MNLGNPTKTICLEKSYTVLKKLKSKSDKCFEQKKKEEKTKKRSQTKFLLICSYDDLGRGLVLLQQLICSYKNCAILLQVTSDKWHILFKSILKSGMRRLGANYVPSNRSFLDGQKHIGQGIFSFSFLTSNCWVSLIVFLEFPIVQSVLMLMAAIVGKIIQVLVVLSFYLRVVLLYAQSLGEGMVALLHDQSLKPLSTMLLRWLFI